jgi:hypothetical protein
LIALTYVSNQISCAHVSNVLFAEKYQNNIRSLLQESQMSNGNAFQFIAASHDAFANAMVLEMVPYQFVGIELGRVWRQEKTIAAFMMFIPYRCPVASIIGVWPFGAQVVPE